MANKTKFQTPDWWHKEPSKFLGTVQNPHTRRWYDLWLISTSGDGFSATARHGDEDYEYGSMRLFDNMIRFHGEKADQDLIWGMNQVLIASLWYLAFKTTPFIRWEEEYILEFGEFEK